MKRFLLFMTIAILFTVWGCSKKVVTSETAVGQIPKKEAAQTEAVKEKETAAVTAPVEAPSITPEAVKQEEAVTEEKEAAAVAAPVEVPSIIPETVKSKEAAIEEKETAAVTAPVEAPSIIPEAVKSKEAAIEEKETAAVTAPVEVLKLQDIFFDFDRFLIREEARPVLETNADYLKANKDSKILIEGHCDERGTSEYNMALGERRAQSAKKYLIDLGIDPSRISTISYGKEKPFCTDHNEGCWQENRRAHFTIK
ncbi:MAG: peptidoglycan-associated lipoprotein Pal [Deltaproteobacteria bacterium]|nr:peptidoglycan-associated lipoprotein Pal [Deltaproteobacteria bacterium]